MNNLSDSNFDPSSDANLGRSISLTFASFCFFIGMQIYIAGQSIPRNCKKSNESWKRINITVSFSHSFIVSILLFSSFYLYPEILTEPLTFHNSHINAVICFTTGYFIWDVYDMVQSGNLLKLWEVVVHHAGVLFNLFYNLATNRYLSLSMIALIVEVNSVFLHARKLLQMSDQVLFSSWIYVKVCQINLLTFATLRGTILLYATWALFYYFHFFTTSYVNIFGSMLFTSWPMNLILFWRLVKSDILRNTNKSKNIEPVTISKMSLKEAMD